MTNTTIINDTIAAPATAIGGAGIGIIRISGSEAVTITAQLFPAITQMKSHTIRYGFLIDGTEIIDEVMVTLMKAPHSYTREDVVEINCHGGSLMMQHILRHILECGARLAEPGEFSKRAFLNGRLDLSQADAVMDIIGARNEAALKLALNQLRGALSAAVSKLRADILRQVAYIEAALDDPEHYDLDGYGAQLSEQTQGFIERIAGLLESADQGRIIKEGIDCAIIGKPNVGKSSLYNLLLGEERAIVTDIAGTTRDTLSESAMVGRLMLNLMDTAGIRATADKIEQLGVERSIKSADEAQLVIFMLDLSRDIDDTDRHIARQLGMKKLIILLNKADLARKATEKDIGDIVDRLCPHGEKTGDGPPVLICSTKDRRGMDELRDSINEMFLHDGLANVADIHISNIRHIEALTQAHTSMCLVRQGLSEKMPEDVLCVDLMDAYESLGTIIGERVGDDLVNEIFSNFCLGK